MSTDPPRRRRRAPAALAALAALLAAAGCGTRLEPGGNCPQVETPRSYADDVAPLLAQNCTPCHSSTLRDAKARSGAPLGIDYDTFDRARDNAGEGNQDVMNGRMPQYGPLTGDAACVLDGWIQGGFLP